MDRPDLPWGERNSSRCSQQWTVRLKVFLSCSDPNKLLKKLNGNYALICHEIFPLKIKKKV